MENSVENFSNRNASTHEVLHQQALQTATKFHEAESELIDILQKIDDQKTFVHLGFSSLFDYSTKSLKLSEANASNFITVARKSKSVPELKAAIQTGMITVSKARKITPVLTSENSSHWLQLAQTLPKPQLEKEVARVMPQQAVQEKARYVTETRLELKLGVSEELMQKLRRAQDLISQKERRSATLEEALDAILISYLQKQDPVEKAKRFEVKTKSKDPNNAAASVLGTHSRRYITAQTKHQVYLRDQGQCAHIDKENKRCESRRWLDIHHIIPISQKGTHATQNLITLCYNHHKQMHI